MKRCALLLAVLSAACAVSTQTSSPARIPYRIAHFEPVPGFSARGASGLTGRGPYWTIGERDHKLVELTLQDGQLTPGRVIRVGALPQGQDAESIVHLGDEHFAIGTEAHSSGRPSDPIHIGKLVGDEFVATMRIEFPYGLWGLSAQDNRGVEGLCFAGHHLLAGVEQVIQEGGDRFAPLGVFDRTSQKWSAHRVRLTTGTGKLSGMDCRPTERGIELFAIERHYGVARILRFELTSESATTLEAEVVVDIAAQLEDPPNFEALALTDDGFVLITDNDHGGIAGPTRQLVIEPEKALRRRPLVRDILGL